MRNVISEAIALKMNDPRVESMTTVTRVELSADLLRAKVLLSMPGSEATERKMMAAMQSARGYLQTMVANRLQSRQCPSLCFAIDEGAKTARETMRILEENRRKDPALFESQDAEEVDPEGPPDHCAQPGEEANVEDGPNDTAANNAEETGE